MKKIIPKQPTRGGLTPVRVDDLAYKTGLTVNLVCKQINIKPKSTPDSSGDSIETLYEKQIIDEDGVIVSIQKLGYIVKDTGDVCEYDTFEENLFSEEDINNPDYIKTLVDEIIVSIHYVDGQIEELDPDDNVVLVDNIVFIEPIEKKGEINYSTEVVIDAGAEPLADWTAVVGDMITSAVVNQMLVRNGYDAL